MKRPIRYNKIFFNIKNKWTNSTRTVTMSNCEDIREAHKYAYYKHTSNLEDIVSITDSRKKPLFCLYRGFLVK